MRLYEVVGSWLWSREEYQFDAIEETTVAVGSIVENARK
jgi:hypothetical protein